MFKANINYFPNYCHKITLTYSYFLLLATFFAVKKVPHGKTLTRKTGQVRDIKTVPQSRKGPVSFLRDGSK